MAQGRICVYVLRVSFGIGRLDDFSVLFTKSYHNSLTEREIERDIDRKRERERDRESHTTKVWTHYLQRAGQ